jgi:hypothetical protein
VARQGFAGKIETRGQRTRERLPPHVHVEIKRHITPTGLVLSISAELEAKGISHVTTTASDASLELVPTKT